MNRLILIWLVAFVAVSGCDSDSSSLFDPDYEAERPDPVITQIEPEDGWLAGVDEIVIIGENFSEEIGENRVYFDGIPGIIHSATNNELVVRPAQTVGDSVPVKATVIDAINFSNVLDYKLDQAVFYAPGSNSDEDDGPVDNSLAITADSEGSIYYSNQQDGIAEGILQWTNDGSVDVYLNSTFNWTSLKLGPDGLMYGARNVFGIYREPPSGSIDNNPFAVGNSGEAYRDMDFDPDDNLWAVGDNEDIFRIDIESGTIDRFPFEANLRAVRYFDGKLYMGGRFDNGTEEGSLEIWTMDINDGEPSNPQQILNISDATEEDFTLFSLTFDADGTLYLGTDTGTGIYTWNESEGLNEFYPDLIEPTGFSLSWVDNFLVASAIEVGEESRFPLKIDVRKEGAPYYGVD